MSEEKAIVKQDLTKDPDVIRVYEKLSNWTSGVEVLNLGTIVLLLSRVISLVEELKVDSAKKKVLAIGVMKKVVSEHPNADELYTFIDYTAPVLIDTMVSIANNREFLFKKVKEEAKEFKEDVKAMSKGCFKGCF